MVGGDNAAFARAEPILAAMGKAVIHAGGSGAGQAAKICNNMILGATMIATCEAFAMAQKLGLDPQVFYDISSKASGQSWSMTSYCPLPGVGPQSPADNDYQGGFATALMLKDLKLAVAAARDAGSQVPMGARAEELYEAFAAAGNGGSISRRSSARSDSRNLDRKRRADQRIRAAMIRPIGSLSLPARRVDVARAGAVRGALVARLCRAGRRDAGVCAARDSGMTPLRKSAPIPRPAALRAGSVRAISGARRVAVSADASTVSRSFLRGFSL
jgi:hypothetical protein